MYKRKGLRGQKKKQKKKKKTPTGTKAHNQPRTNRRIHPHPPTNPWTHPPSDPPTHVLQQYSNNVQQYTCIQFVRSAPSSSGESTMCSKNENAKRQPPMATNPLAHPHTHRPNQPSRTSLPTNDVLQQFSSKYSSTCVGTCRVYPCVVLGFPLFYDSTPPRGASDPSPGGCLSTPPAR